MTRTHRGSRHYRGPKTPTGRTARPDKHLDVDEPRYLLGQVAKAAGISSSLLKAWMARKVILMGEFDREAHGKGSSRVFTLRRAIAIGLAAEFVKMGISIALAGDISHNAIDMILEGAGGDISRIDHLMAMYPEGDLGVGYAAAHWDSRIEEVLGENGLEGASSVMIVSVKLVAERVLKRLGELENPQPNKAGTLESLGNAKRA
jgi:hypothetical protein